MKINLNVPIRDFKGVAFGDGSTVQSVILQALQAPLRGDDEIGGPEKFRLFRIGMKIAESDDVALTAEEIATIKKRVAKAFGGAVVAGRVAETLDPNDSND